MIQGTIISLFSSYQYTIDNSNWDSLLFEYNGYITSYSYCSVGSFSNLQICINKDNQFFTLMYDSLNSYTDTFAFVFAYNIYMMLYYMLSLMVYMS